MSLFIYGTLLVPEIWELVTASPLSRNEEDAILHGYRIRRVRGGDFPGITEGESCETVRGKIVRNLCPSIIAKLDVYEDSFYERLPVTVTLPNGDLETAETYLVPGTSAGRVLSHDSWSLDWFLENAGAAYLRRLKKWI